MPESTKKNAIERRMEELEGLWNEFAEDPQARLLRWVVDSDSARMLDLFLELQNEEVSEIPDLFIRFNEPFEDPASHGRMLRASLLAMYEDIRQGIAEEGIPVDWSAPPIIDGQADIDAFVQICSSLREYYDDIMVNLVAVLTPVTIADLEAWQNWLRCLVGSELPPNVRFMVVDNAESPHLDGLASAESELVTSIDPELEMPQAFAELAFTAPGVGPGFEFRRYFIALSTAASAGNVVLASQAAAAALSIAQEHNWPQMITAVNMALGAAHFAAGDVKATLRSYRDANKAIAGQADPAAPKLDIQTRFAEAAALISDEQYEGAAQVYEEIAPLAEKHEESFSLLESWRMAAWCHETMGNDDRAWECAERALDAGALLDEETRAASTLPYVGQLLLRLIQSGTNAEQEDNVHQRMVALAGEDWEERVEQGATAS